MSPENTHKLMGFYMEVTILGVNTMYMLFCFFKLFLVGYTGLKKQLCKNEWVCVLLSCDLITVVIVVG